MKLISFARRTPIACCNNTVRPHPGITPTRVWVSPKRARSDATRKSQLSAISNPPVIAGPLIAPITGLSMSGNGPRAVGRGSSRSSTLAGRRLPVDDPSSFRSRPAQKAGSAPVRITTSTSSRPSASRINWGSRRSTSDDSALRASGRFSVTVAIRSVTSSSTGSMVTAGPLPRRAEGTRASSRRAARVWMRSIRPSR